MSLTDWITASPPLRTQLSRYRLETVDLLLQVQSRYPPLSLVVEAWTNLPTQVNAEGVWSAIEIPYQAQAAAGYRFQKSVRPTSPGKFELTYRVRLRSHPDQVQWLGPPDENVHLQIEPPVADAIWTQGPNAVEIMPGVFVGNFMAASQADSLGFDAVLNMAEELHPTIATDPAIAYCQLPCRDAAQHPIPEAVLHQAVHWIETQRAQGKQRVLVHCRAGIGRSGSVGIAYTFYKHPHWSYSQVLDFVWSRKPDIYPYCHLQMSLEHCFPRLTRWDPVRGSG